MASVAAVASRPEHAVSKVPRDAIRLVEGLGVDGDTHAGVTVQHRSRVRADPTQANLRQVHLIHAELHDELIARGFAVGPAVMGENVTTRGIDLLGLATGTRLQLGEAAILEITGLRNPCTQLDGIQPGLMAATIDRAADGSLIRRAGVMGVVLAGGDVRPGDAIAVVGVPADRVALRPV
jgi:MOSC domain-containing protein YiiM